MNTSKLCEMALKSAMIAAGIAKTDVFYNAFQVPEVDERGKVSRRFPQIMYGCAVDVPNGFNEPFRRVPTTLTIMTTAVDDPARLVIAGLYEKVRSMIDTANTDPGAWTTSAYLPAGYTLSAIVIEDSPPPYFDEEWGIIEVSFTMEICVV